MLFLKNAVTLSFYPPIKVILRTIFGAIQDVLLFMVLFILVLVGFSMFAHIVVGHTIGAFDSPFGSIIRCMDIVVGNFDAVRTLLM